MSKHERRTFFSTNLRALTQDPDDDEDDDLVIEGRAAPYNTLSSDLGGFRERLAKGAFRSAVEAKQDVCCLMNHNPDFLLGRTSSGTLKLVDGPDGLHFRCELSSDSQSARDVHASIKRGDMNACSFAFSITPEDQTWTQEKDENNELFACRTITNIRELHDVSPVTYPAYPNGTAVGARSLVVPAEPFTVVDVEIPVEFRSLVKRTTDNLTRRRRDLLRAILS